MVHNWEDFLKRLDLIFDVSPYLIRNIFKNVFRIPVNSFTGSVLKIHGVGVPVSVLDYVFLYCNFLTEVKKE